MSTIASQVIGKVKVTDRKVIIFAVMGLGFIGSLGIILCSIFLPQGPAVTAGTSLVTFLGAILTFLYGAYHLLGNQQAMSDKTDRIEETVNGERKKMQTVIYSAIANHPEVASKAQEIGLTLETHDDKARNP